jgi:hypothetical protein
LTPTDRVTVVLFKDHHHPRSFEVSLGWVKKMGGFLGLAALVTVLSLGSAIRSGWIARTSRPEALKRMEEDNRNLRTSNESLERQVGDLQEQAKLLTQTPGPTPSTATIDVSPLPSSPADPVSRPTPATAESSPESQPLPSLWARLWAQLSAERNSERQSSSPTQTAESSASSHPTDSAGAAGTGSILLEGIPAFVPVGSWVDGIPEPAQIKITLTPATTQLRANRLSVKFALQYSANDGKNQQGRIILLARSPSGILAYPEGALNGMSSPNLIAPERGEFFSVSRYREVATDFDLPPASAGAFKEIEVLLFKTDGKILVHQKIDITTAAPASDRGPRPPRPNPTGDIILPPGTDR